MNPKQRKRSTETSLEFLETFFYEPNKPRKIVKVRKPPLPRLPFVIISCIDEYLQHNACNEEECGLCHTSSFRSLHTDYIEEMIYHKRFSQHKLTQSQGNAVLEMIRGKNHTIILGMPGTGKSSILRVFRKVVKWVGLKTAEFYAHTGVAAVNVDGNTIASRFGQELNDLDLFWDKKNNWYKKNAMNKPHEPSVANDFNGYIVIDEVSQVCKDTFNKLLDIARRRKKKLIFAGDIMQLEPVKSSGGICLLGNRFNKLLSFVVLTDVKRQAESEVVLRELIHNVGFGENDNMVRKTLHELKHRYEELEPNERRDILHIATTNKDVDVHNKSMYNSFRTEEFLHLPVVHEVFEVHRKLNDDCLECVTRRCSACQKKEKMSKCRSCTVVKWCDPCSQTRVMSQVGSSEWSLVGKMLLSENAVLEATTAPDAASSNEDMLERHPGLAAAMNMYRASETIRLKVGIRIMVTKNISLLSGGAREVVPNGTTGRLVSINKTRAIIECDATGEHTTIPYRTHRLYFKSKPTKQEPRTCTLVSRFATVAYYPLVCCFACTIHKSQGLTMSRVVIDMGYYSYPVQAALLYVALSRCTSLNGVYLKNFFNMNRIKRDEDCIVYFRKLLETARASGGKPFTLN